MRIKTTEISVKTKNFLKYSPTQKEWIALRKERELFIEANKNIIEVIENKEILNVDMWGKPEEKGNYSGYSIKYYRGFLEIEGKNNENASKINMKLILSKQIINLVLQQASGDIKDLVKKEYEEFTNELEKLITKAQQKNIFGNFVATKFNKIKKLILEEKK
jgi:hypothetical protein